MCYIVHPLIMQGLFQHFAGEGRGGKCVVSRYWGGGQRMGGGVSANEERTLGKMC